MSGAKVRKLVGLRDYTHFLRIPLAASVSTSQLDSSFMRFQNDTSLIVPPAAIVNPRFYELPVARLNLPTSRHIHEFSSMLRKYDMSRGLKAGPTVMRPSSDLEAKGSSNASTVKKGSINTGVLPLTINLRGLSAAKGRDPTSTPRLVAEPIDPTNRLPQLLLSLREFLNTTGFMATAEDEDTAHQYINDRVMIVNTLIVQWWVKRPQRFREVPKFDARDLIDKYRTYEWGTDIPLEEIRLERLGSMAKRSDGSAVRKQRVVDATFKLF